jgi:hypothetical protein
LRHGKQANADNASSRQQAKERAERASAPAPTHNKSAPAATEVRAPAAEHHEHRRERKAGGGANDYREEAERIVAEEKAQGERMPRYTGLEEYDLVEKMGDGAFSNVYKAIERKTGRKVAVKVVRKYELNHSQVSRVRGRL